MWLTEDALVAMSATMCALPDSADMYRATASWTWV
jgi:hypothetical protein